MTFTVRLEQADGTPADPPSFRTSVLRWEPGDTTRWVRSGRFRSSEPRSLLPPLPTSSRTASGRPPSEPPKASKSRRATLVLRAGGPRPRHTRRGFYAHAPPSTFWGTPTRNVPP
jgi:hypothetical protein